MNQEGFAAIEYWKHPDHGSHGLSCPRVGGKKNKKLKGGTLPGHSEIIDSL